MRFPLTLLLALLATALPLSAAAETATGALTDAIDERAEAGGSFDEIDASPAQAEAIEEGEDAGLSPTARRTVEEIVVSARKRDELLEDTPVSVTALDANALAEAGITDLREVRQLVPNLQFENTAISSTLASNLRIRGIGTPGASTSFDPGVGVYLDGMYLPRNLSAILDVVDVAQVEVLRGPQGTLFGKNTIGGALNISSTRPQDELDAFMSVRAANHGTVETRAMLNVPIADWIATRVSVASKNRQGWLENTFRNETMFDLNSVAFLGSVQIRPAESLTIDITGNFSRNNSRGQGNTCQWESDATPAFGPSLLPGLEEACDETTWLMSTANYPPLYRDKTYGAWGTITWDVGELGPIEELSVVGRGSWRAGGIETRIDLDGTHIPALAVDLTEEANGPGGSTSGDSYVAELQTNFTALDGRLQGALGIFGFHEKTALPTNIITQNTLFTRQILTKADISNRDIAAYGQVSLDVTQWLELTAGIRWTEEVKNSDLDRVQTDNGQITDEGQASGSETFQRWTPMASLAATMPEAMLDGTPIEHLMAYFTWSQGFRGGGFNTTATGSLDLQSFAPETLDSFEVGFKTGMLDQRLGLNLSAFLYNYDDLQVLASRTNCTDPDDATTCATTQVVENAGTATGRGVEIELKARPFGPLLVSGSVGLLDTEYTNFPNASPELVPTPGSVNRAGESFNNAPALQTHVSLMMPLPVDIFENSSMNGYLVPRIDWYYQSAVHFNAVEVTSSNQPGYNLLHARLSYDFFDDRAQVALFGSNLTNQEYIGFSQNLAPFFGIVSTVYGPPRTFGAEISWRFH